MAHAARSNLSPLPTMGYNELRVPSLAARAWRSNGWSSLYPVAHAARSNLSPPPHNGLQ